MKLFRNNINHHHASMLQVRVTLLANIIINAVLLSMMSTTTSVNASLVDDFNPNIKIEKTVNLGGRSGSTCAEGVEEVSGPNATPVTYTFVITNIGDVCLDNVVLNDTGLNYNTVLFPQRSRMFPGTVITKCFSTKIYADQFSDAIVSGDPIFCESGANVPGLQSVQDSDPAGVKKINSTAECTSESQVTELPDKTYLITKTSTCRECDCPEDVVTDVAPDSF